MASWFGLGTYTIRYNNLVIPAVIPPPIPPSDISDIVLWLDAADTSTIEVNEDTSGVNVNRVMKWFDKANPSNQNYFTHDGNPAGSGLYNVHSFPISLPVVYFEANAYMNHSQQGFELPFQARTVFYVIKPLSNLEDASSVLLPIFTGDASGGMSIAIAKTLGGFTYAMNPLDLSGEEITFDLSANPINTRMLVSFAQTDQIDLSGNAASYDTNYQPLVFDNYAANYNENVIQYILNSPTANSSFDLAELIVYGRLLNSFEQTIVLEYLARKWNTGGGSNISAPSVPQQVVEEVVPPEEGPPPEPV